MRAPDPSDDQVRSVVSTRPSTRSRNESHVVGRTRRLPREDVDDAWALGERVLQMCAQARRGSALQNHVPCALCMCCGRVLGECALKISLPSEHNLSAVALQAHICMSCPRPPFSCNNETERLLLHPPVPIQLDTQPLVDFLVQWVEDQKTLTTLPESPGFTDYHDYYPGYYPNDWIKESKRLPDYYRRKVIVDNDEWKDSIFSSKRSYRHFVARQKKKAWFEYS